MVDVVAYLEPCVGTALALWGHIPTSTHGPLLLVVPTNVHAEVFFAVLIFRALEVNVENLEQALGMFSANVFHAKIVDAEREGDGSQCLFPQPQCNLALLVPMLIQPLFQ
jgi:hypothetical protein